MEILSGLEALPEPRLAAPIVTWGVFDGVHRGHRKVIGETLSWARREGLSSVVVTFDRHPREVLEGIRVPMLSPLGERLRLISAIGVDFCLLINFTREFARRTAGEFVRDIVAGGLRARGVLLGSDARFGRDREGDLDSLRGAGLEVRDCGPEIHEGRAVSSSLVREAISAGRVHEARLLLGRPPSVIGTVVRGGRRGSRLGFPTANLELHYAVRPRPGVYAAETPLEGRDYRAVVNFGTRPTFEIGGAEVLEVHLLDFQGGDLYGRMLEVRLLSRIRDERKFPDAGALRRRIEEDVRIAREG